MDYFLSCEGETERWYFEWLQKQINNDKRTVNTVKFHFITSTPSSFAKSNRGTFTKGLLNNPCYCRIQDIEDYADEHVNSLHKLLDSCKQAQSLYKKCSFYIGYSNLTFEVWIIAHKTAVKEISDRKNYYNYINSSFEKDFKNNKEYKKEKNFNSLLSTITLDDVINKALPECSRFKKICLENHAKHQRKYCGFTYILSNPHTTLDDFVKVVLQNAGIL